MAEKRQDNKGRVLRAGESQRSDGKYEYKYADSNSERHSVYSWKLVATDKVPEGKQGGTSLRDMEKQIQKDLEDNLLIYQTRKMALNSFWDQYIELKKRTVMRKRKKMQKRNVESLNCYRISVATICDIHSALAFVRTKLT